MPVDDDLTLLCDAARMSGEIAMKHFRKDPEVWEKQDNQGPVSEADLAVDAALQKTLLTARPDYGWLSEESSVPGDRQAAEKVFIVDPIDGTRAFLSGQTTFAHALAIAQAGEVIAAAVYLPAMDKLYTAQKGAGAAQNGRAIQHSGTRRADGATVLSNATNMKPEFWAGTVPNLKRHFRPSLAYRMCLVAEGRFDAMLTFRNAWEWDIAAGDLICSEAGALVTTAAGGKTRYNSSEAYLPGIVAATPDVHADILAAAK